MTYKEARDYIENNSYKISERVAKTNPPSELWATFVAPETLLGDAKLGQHFFNEIVLNNLSNEVVLTDLSLQAFVSDKLRPFIILRMRGNPIILELQGYLREGFSGVQ